MPIVDFLGSFISLVTRLLISLISALFFIIPMTVLICIQPKGYVLCAAAVFAIFFGVVIAMTSRAKHHELFGVAAGYVAILVVFVGNAIDSHKSG